MTDQPVRQDGDALPREQAVEYIRELNTIAAECEIVGTAELSRAARNLYRIAKQWFKALEADPPKPASDAMREALGVIARGSEGLLHAVRAGDNKAQLMIHIGGLMVDVEKAIALAGAAEPVGWQWRKKGPGFEADGTDVWSYIDYNEAILIKEHPEKYEVRALYAAPPVRGDWEATIRECANIARVGAKDCTDGDTDWHKGFRYAANATALEIESAILSLPSAPVSGRDAVLSDQVVVPKEPTPEMLDGGIKASIDLYEKLVKAAHPHEPVFLHADIARMIVEYRAMIAAAPPSPPLPKVNADV